MATAAEQVITEMILNASKYVSGSKQVIAANKAMNSSLQALVTRYQSVQKAVGSMSFGSGNTFNIGGGSGSGSNKGGFGNQIAGAYLFVRALREVEHVIVDAGRRLIDVSEDALKEYASFNTIQLSFDGIYHGANKATQMMTYLREVAMTSAFHFRDLADAARSISVAGLDVNRFLPMAQGFALAMGHIDSGGLQDFISILRRLQGGNTGVALGPRGIGRYGVGRNELETAGAKFDSHGRFLGTINEAFDAIERVFTNRIKGISDKVSGSVEVTLSNLFDSVQQAMIDFGHGVSDNVMDPIKEITSAINGLRQSGFFQDFADTLYEIIGIGDIIGTSKPLQYDFSKDPTTGRQLTADEQKKAERDYEKQRFGESGPFGRTPTTTGDSTQDLLIQIGGGIVSAVEFLKLLFQELNDIWQAVAQSIPTLLGMLIGAVIGAADAPVSGILAVMARLLPGIIGGGLLGYAAGKYASDNADDSSTLYGAAAAAGQSFKDRQYGESERAWKDRLRHPGRYSAPRAPEGNAIPGDDDDSAQEQEKQTKHLSGIHEHIKAIRDHFERRAQGGGSIGEAGVTPVELSRYHNNAYKHNAAAIMTTAGQAIDQMVTQIIHDAISNAMRQGYLMGSSKA